MIKGVRIPFIHNEFYAVLFGIIIINVGANEKSILSLENPMLNYLGKISYGLYMLHPVAIVLSIKLMEYFSYQNNVVLYLVCVLFSILAASVSYELFEKGFLKLKYRYTKVLSGDQAASQGEIIKVN